MMLWRSLFTLIVYFVGVAQIASGAVSDQELQVKFVQAGSDQPVTNADAYLSVTTVNGESRLIVASCDENGLAKFAEIGSLGQFYVPRHGLRCFLFRDDGFAAECGVFPPRRGFTDVVAVEFAKTGLRMIKPQSSEL